MNDQTGTFEGDCAHLSGIAYRMLGELTAWH
jgi:hypothetical protein